MESNMRLAPDNTITLYIFHYFCNPHSHLTSVSYGVPNAHGHLPQPTGGLHHAVFRLLQENLSLFLTIVGLNQQLGFNSEKSKYSER